VGEKRDGRRRNGGGIATHSRTLLISGHPRVGAEEKIGNGGDEGNHRRKGTTSLPPESREAEKIKQEEGGRL